MNKAISSRANRSLFKVLAVNGFLLLLFLEVVPLLFFFITDGRWAYTRAPKPHKLREELNQTGMRIQGGEEPSEEIFSRLHPYFGYVLKPGLFSENPFGLRVNNYGFFSAMDYPIEKTADHQLVLAVLGGSVAADVANHEVIHRGSPASIVGQLKNVPELEDKEFLVLNFASGGYKQPQQLLILMYFLSIGQEIDLILNVDGFNEVALTPLNQQAGIPVAMPSFQHLNPLTALADTDIPVVLALGEIAGIKSQLLEQIDQLEHGQLAFTFMVRSFRVKGLFRSYQKRLLEMENSQSAVKHDSERSENSLISIPAQLYDSSEANTWDQIIEVWAESSILIHQVALSRQIPYFQVIQPNQYHPTDRKFTEKELMLFGNSPYSTGVEYGYPLLLRRAEVLRSSGLPLFNAVTLFDNEETSVYRDGCCHFTLKGQEIFSEFIGKEMGDWLMRNSPKESSDNRMRTKGNEE